MTNEFEYIFPDIKFGVKNLKREAKYSGFTLQSKYVTMSDGVKIAVDIYLPDNLQDKKIPTLIYRTRYWRNTELTEPTNQVSPDIMAFISYGYAIIKLDVRGTGASFGTMIHEWQPKDLEDLTEIIDWIIQQSWSDGQVGGYGISYPGTTAELLAAVNHPAAKSTWATYFELDGFVDIACPGGIPSLFIQTWGQYTQALDHNINVSGSDQVIGVKPVDEDKDKSMLKKAVEGHIAENNHVHELMADNIFRDQPMKKVGKAFDDMMVYTQLDKIKASNLPIDIWGSWMDANTPDTVIRHFVGVDNPQRAVINPWNHGGSSFNSQYVPEGSPLEIPYENQFLEIMRYMDHSFYGIDHELPEKILYYFTMGEEKWKSTTEFPIPGTIMKTLFMNAGNLLSNEKPESGNGEDKYKVDYSTTTGKRNRWWTELGGGAIQYGNRAEEDKKLLCYDSEPLEEDMEITGYPIITLQMACNLNDVGLFVYLEDVDPEGYVRHITEGQFRPLHRKVSTETPPYPIFGPYHTFKEEDQLPLTPGEIVEVPFFLIPTSVLIKKGHKIRVAIAGADADTFSRVPKEGNPEITIARSSTHLSKIELPVIPR